MNEEKVKRGKGRPKGSLSHIMISTNELAKYCADHPNETIMVSRIFWEKRATGSIAQPLVEIKPDTVSAIETNNQPRVLGDMFMRAIPVNEPQIEMTLSE